MPYAIGSLVVLVLVTLLVIERLKNPHVLARIGSVDRLRRVLARSPGALDRKDAGGETPLMHAAKYDEFNTTQFLLKAGANANALCKGGGTALMMASACGCNRTVPLLLSAGANVNAADDAGVTPLHYAAGLGLSDTVRLLLAAGADTTLRDVAGRTPSTVAAEAGLEDVARMVSDGAQQAAASDEARGTNTEVQEQSSARLAPERQETLADQVVAFEVSMLKRLLVGLIGGLLVAAACLLVVAIRALIAIASGKGVDISRSDAVMFAYYVAGFAAAGLVVAVIWPLMQGRLATYLGFALAGIIVCIGCIAGQAGGLPARGLSDWLFAAVYGTLIGCAFAFGFTRKIRKVQPNEEV